MKSIQWNDGFLGWEWIAIGSLGLLLVLFYLEFRKNRKTRLNFRLICIFFMVLSLALLALKPAWRVEQKPIAAILLTEGYKEQLVDSLQNSSEHTLKVFVNDHSHNRLNSISVSGIEQIINQYPEVEKLYIIGNSPSDLESEFLQSLTIIPLLNPAPDGIAEIEFSDEVNINEQIQISGRLKNDQDSIVELILIAPHGKGDSVSLTGGKSGFSLTANPKLAGRFLYTLLEKRPGSGGEKKYILPIVVKPFKPLNLAVRTHAPNFETRSLKNWLGETGHWLALKSRISKEVYHQEFINQKERFSADISEANLAKLDALIIEGAALSSLSRSNLSALNTAISEQGLALIILGDQESINKRTENTRPFFNFNIETTEREEQILKQIINGKNIQGEIQKLPLRILDESRIESHFEGLYAIRNHGLGKVGLLLSTTTYTLNLAGKSDLYNYYWTEVINKVLPEHSFEPAWELSDQLNFVNTETYLKLTNYPEIPDVSVTDEDSTAVTIAMLQNIDFSEQWQGKFWPSAEGWHSVRIEDRDSKIDYQDPSRWFYIQPDSTWETLLHSRSLRKMQHLIKNDEYNSKTANKSPQYFYTPIDKVYFFAIFLLSCGLLWIEQKL